jgi:phosphoribosylanthranilate isomerase
MKTSSAYFSILFMALLSALTVNADAQNAKKTAISAANGLEVIQFHSEHRCKTCNNIESNTRETLKGFSGVSFSLINVDDAKNAKKAEQFEAAGTALYLYNAKTGRKKDLTDFAFMNAGNKEKFIEGLKREIASFQK